jgi:dTDP-glucose 4,6-dehydratase
VRRLLSESEALVFNLDKCGYPSDLTSIEALPQAEARHQLLKVDLTDAAATAAAVQQAESHVSGTFQLLQAVRAHWEGLSAERKAGFRFYHISSDEVFGSLGATGRFSETTPYDPRSPYSASKAASAHQLQQQLRLLAGISPRS